jgi:hypothetical protein
MVQDGNLWKALMKKLIRLSACNRFIPEKSTDVLLLKKFLTVLAPENLLPCSQQPLLFPTSIQMKSVHTHTHTHTHISSFFKNWGKKFDTFTAASVV